jgi:hypothetical protein
MFFNYNAGTWGFGFTAGIQASGGIDLSGNILSFNNATDDTSEASAAAFLSARINTFFHVQKFKVKFSPALYYTLAYTNPHFSYTFNETNDGTVLRLNYDLSIYTILPLDFSSLEFNGSPGFDFSIGVEYPLAREIGLTNLIPILDFDVGLDLINIPIVSSRMNNSLKITGEIGTTEPINFTGDLSDIMSVFNSDNTVVQGTDANQGIERPFTMLVWANWRPLIGSELLTITPIIGFTVNPLYLQPLSMEVGLKTKVNLINILIATVGINYNDRVWRNSLDLALNLRAFELNLGVSLESPSFASSWNASGLGVNVGLKFGW